MRSTYRMASPNSLTVSTAWSSQLIFDPYVSKHLEVAGISIKNPGFHAPNASKAMLFFHQHKNAFEYFTINPVSTSIPQSYKNIIGKYQTLIHDHQYIPFP